MVCPYTGDAVSSHADTQALLNAARAADAREAALLAEIQRLHKREETVRGNLYLYSIGELDAPDALEAIREALAGDTE